VTRGTVISGYKEVSRRSHLKHRKEERKMDEKRKEPVRQLIKELKG